MAGRGIADVVFVVDSSYSMSPCIEGVKNHIASFVNVFRDDANTQWDLRFELLAHSTLFQNHTENHTFWARSVHEESLLAGLYGKGQGRFFTSDVSVFQNALLQVNPMGDEAPFLALDCALDLPWRDQSDCHRIVVLLTDEPVETGVFKEESFSLSDALIEKLHALKVILFLVTPDSVGFELLSAADKSEWEVVESGDGLASVDFQNLLTGIAKSISKSQTPLAAPPPAVNRALFGQDGWQLVESKPRADQQ
jgi:hypothetical protein